MTIWIVVILPWHPECLVDSAWSTESDALARKDAYNQWCGLWRGSGAGHAEGHRYDEERCTDCECYSDGCEVVEIVLDSAPPDLLECYRPDPVLPE